MKTENTLLKEIRDLILTARKTVVKNVNTIQVITNFEIGRRICLYEQQGKLRADYGAKILEKLSQRLVREFGNGFSLTNLKLMRQFYIVYSKKIGQTVSDQLRISGKSQMPSDQLQILQAVPAKTKGSSFNFLLSWSHYVFLMSIKDNNERSFYEIESYSNNWSLRELKRQYNSGLYERLALSRDKKKMKELSEQGQVIEKPQDILKEPYVLEFLGLEEKSKYSETELETAIINKLEHFLLELGKGFLFEARQKRFTFDETHFFVDLVFYNRLLKCYVLIDLKIGELNHRDLGQMQMYVNYYDRHIKIKDENPTIGIILCKKKKDAIVEITLPKDANIHAREYKLYLPSKKQLKQKLLEWIKES